MIISVFDYSDYRVFLNTWIDSQHKRGIKGHFSKALGISSTMVSLILKGEKQLSLEQAAEAIDYLGLKEKEADYFFLLVELGKAGTHKLRQKLKHKINESQKEAKQISKRLRKDLELTEEQKAIYYSSWVFTGIRNLSALEQFSDTSRIAERLNIPVALASKTLDFLISNGLCKFENGKLSYGPAYTHVASDSPFVIKHHQNWRVRGFQNMELNEDKNLFYTCPMSLSKEAADQVRSQLLKAIQEIWKTVEPSKSEEVYCFNIDWFKY